MDCKKFLFLVFILFGCTKESIRSGEHQLADQLAGQWELEGAIRDGELMEEWVGLTLSFEKSGSVQGVYEMPLSLDDSVWSTKGSWLVEDEFTFIKDDIESVSVLPDPNSSSALILSFERPSISSQQDSCNTDTVNCIIPIVEGYWSFLLNRAE